jgi:acetate kinase
MKALILNTGSSSLKFGLFELASEQSLADGGIDWSHEPTWLVLNRSGQPPIKEQLNLRGHADAISRVVHDLGAADIEAVGHRIVHGGSRYTKAVRLTESVEEMLDHLTELAPLHNAASLEVVRAAQKLLPKAVQVAAFDTAFHSTLSEAAYTYPVPRQWTKDWQLRRFGFHGLSLAYCTTRAAEMLGGRDLRLVIAHLGNGASVSAIDKGKSVDTSMGFTPLDGLMMGTRSGSVDPGMLVYLLRHKGLSADQLDHALNYESGLLGVSGISSDMRQVLAARDKNPDARLAIDVYIHRLTRMIGAMAAVLGSVDALVFTGGIGEHSPVIRQRACANLAFLGLELDDSANTARQPDADIASAKSNGRILVINTREDLTIVREIRKLIHSE